eukprot:TRINITY_DN2102_c0_g1_i1.p1 TRINITY_DN2102_c0_g1~~TRINITY_DN2102_c0_g1_i1.p1  ORF type:complete len:307 (+),score=77.85 TRINITY_DN2102_c0_g1_i1:149-1069(+)
MESQTTTTAPSSSVPQLPEGLKHSLAEVRAKRHFDVAEWVDKKADMLNDYMRKAGLQACVVSVSGGVDSAVVYAIMMRAAKKEGSPIAKTLGIAQPIHSTASIWQRAMLIEKALGGKIIVVDQTPVYDALTDIVTKATGIQGNSFSCGQLRSYMRTPVGYYTAQLLSQTGTGCIVLGTGNKDEDGYLCYFCKAGDGVVDVQLIADLHKSEVYKVGKYLDVPAEILAAPPSADLWEGQTDEEELGFTYDFVELWTEYLALSEEDKSKFKEGVAQDAWAYFEQTGAKAALIHKRNAHKLHFPVNLNIL